MRRSSFLSLAVLSLTGTLSCANRPPVQTVMVPPRVDLKLHEMIGVVEFGSSSEGKLGPITTRRFTEWARRDQGLVRIVDFGSKKKALRSVGMDRWDSETYKALGRERGVKSILIGELTVSDIRPDVRLLASLGSGQVSAQVEATLAVDLIETATGASIWSSSARGMKSVGHVSMFGGKNFVFDAEDPERAYGGLVDTLVDQVTRDFRVTWERR